MLAWAGGALLLLTGLLLGGRALLEEREDEGDAPEEQGDGVAAASGCPAEAVVGNWKLRSTILWDYKLRSMSGRWYDLDLVVHDGCLLTGHLTKWVPEDEVDQRRDSAAVEVHRLSDGRLEIEGAWTIDHNGKQTYVFTLEARGDRMRGDFEHRLPDGRIGVLGAVDGTRRGDPGEIDDWRALPCRSQCRLICAGDLATRSCELERCVDLDADIGDCGLPGDDATTPATATAVLEAREKGAWQATTGGRACSHRTSLVGGWTFHERRGKSTRHWSVHLEEDRGCTLGGSASSDGEEHRVRVEFDDNGRWLLTDPWDPRFAWGLVGQDFVFGEGAGSPAAKIRGQRN